MFWKGNQRAITASSVRLLGEPLWATPGVIDRPQPESAHWVYLDPKVFGIAIVSWIGIEFDPQFDVAYFVRCRLRPKRMANQLFFKKNEKLPKITF